MNILLVSNFFPPHKGGVETAAYNTAKKLAKFGHQVVVITCKDQKDSRNFYQMNGFLVYRFKSYSLKEIRGIHQLSSFGIMPGMIFKLQKIIKKYKIQLIHAEGRLFPLTVITMLLNQIIFKRPMVITAQGRLEIGITGIIENIFDNTITRFFYQKVKKIICVSESLKKRFQNFKINENKLIVIPNGVDTIKFTKNNSVNFFDQYLDDSQRHFKKILFVGRLDIQKGVSYLIKAIPGVIRQRQNVHFIILGNGNLESKLKKLAKSLDLKPYLTFIDMIPLEKMPEIYSSADIFCLPSLHEGFPLTIAEALSIGLIIVASATEGIPDAIKEGKNGFLVSPGNVNQLSEKLLMALSITDGETKKIQVNNRKLAENKYSWNIIVKQLLNVYKEK